MSNAIPRLRMFAGSNGSGKSTIKAVIEPQLMGVYISPDEIEKDICGCGFLDFSAYGVTTAAEEVLGFFRQSSLLIATGFADAVAGLCFNGDKLSFHAVSVTSLKIPVISAYPRGIKGLSEPLDRVSESRCHEWHLSISYS